MATLSRDEFRKLFVACIEQSVAKAQKHVDAPLPQGRRLDLPTSEWPLSGGTVEDALPIIFSDGYFSPFIDVAVQGIADDFTVIWVYASSFPRVNDTEKTRNLEPGLGPFIPVGIMLPGFIYSRPRPLSLNDLREAEALRRERRAKYEKSKANRKEESAER